MLCVFTTYCYFCDDISNWCYVQIISWYINVVKGEKKMSKLVKSTVFSHIGIFNSDSSIFYWEHPHVMYDGRKRNVVVLQVLPHDEERFIVEFIFEEDTEYVFKNEYERVQDKIDTRNEELINRMRKSIDDDTFVGKRYAIQPFEDFKDHILEKFPHEKMDDRDIKLKNVDLTDMDRISMYPYPEHFILTKGLNADENVEKSVDDFDAQYMREEVCKKLSKALNKGDKKDEQND